MSGQQLWALFVPGSDEHYPAPSKEVAEHMARLHNATMEAWLKEHPEMAWGAEFQKNFPGIASIWEGSAEEHASLLAEQFSYSDWDLPAPEAAGGAA